MKKIILSGVQPTGRPHIGNYFGAMKQFVDLQKEEGDILIFIADYHALTSLKDATALKANILDVALDYLAIGLDPERVTLFKQSDVSEHTELAWVFNCITTMPFLMRAHAFKDAEAKNKEINVGKFTYPLLMASDILLYGATHVPVGQDQRQHVEIARDTAEKFNHTFGETFALPEAHILDEVKTVPGPGGQKMSKSYGNTIPLFGSDEEIQKVVMSIVTGSNPVGSPNDTGDTLFTLLSLFLDEGERESVKAEYESGALGYKAAKEMLVAKMLAFTAPMRAQRTALAEDMERVHDILARGAREAKERASAKMQEVKERVGVSN